MTSARKRVVMVAAVADNGVIGLGGDIPWSIPADLKHFRATTRGTNVVVTRQQDWSADGVLVAHSVEEGIALAQDAEGDVMVIGGGHVYRDAMPLADEQILTEVHQTPEGDTHYPQFDRGEWVEVRREKHDGYDFVWWDRATG